MIQLLIVFVSLTGAVLARYSGDVPLSLVLYALTWCDLAVLTLDMLLNAGPGRRSPLTGAVRAMHSEVVRLNGRLRVREWEPPKRPDPADAGNGLRQLKLDDTLSLAEAYEAMARYLSEVTGAGGCVLVPDGKSDAIIGRVNGRSPYRRFTEEFIRLYAPYLKFGEVSVLGFRDGYQRTDFLSDLAAYGFRYSCALPFFDGVASGLAWIGFQSVPHSASSCEARFRQALKTISHEAERFRRLRELHTRARTAEIESKQKSDLFAFASHDMRSPLMNIQAVLGLLRLEGMTGDSPRHLESALRSVGEVDELVRAVIDYSRHQAGALRASPQTVEVRALFERLGAVQECVAEERGVELRWECREKQLAVLADHHQIRRILNNIVGNALKYTPRGGTVSVRGWKLENGRAAIEVRDTGVGMSDRNLEKVFTPFHRFHRDADDGIGLGMVLSKVFTELNSGSIEIASEEGRGTTVSLTFPAAAVSGETEAEIERAAQGARGEILIVDDDVDAAHSLARCLVTAGYEVAVEHCASRALERIRAYPPRVVISDRHFPGGGFDRLIREIRIHSAETRIIVVSGSIPEQEWVPESDAAIPHVLLKPVAPETLFALIERSSGPRLDAAA